MKIIKPFEFGPVRAFRFGKSRFGKPRLASHIYFIDGLLIDTGHSRMRPDILEAISNWSVEQLFITHHHEDHSGNLETIQKRFGWPTYSTPATIDMMKSPPPISFAQWMTWGSRPANFDLLPVEGTLETANYRFELIPTPGHAVDMHCLYESQNGWLFSADLYVHHTIAYFMKSESMKQQIESIQSVLDLDFELMFCGHNPKFIVRREKLTRKLRFFEEFYDTAADLHHRGRTANEILTRMELKERRLTRLLSHGHLSTINLVKSVIRDEQEAGETAYVPRSPV